jgi:hypothetical protein
MKSIFKGVVYKNTYEINKLPKYLCCGNILEYYHDFVPTLSEFPKYVKKEIFYEYDNNNRPFSKGDSVCIDELDTIIKIKSVLRYMNGDYVYETDYLIRIEEDLEAKHIAEEKLKLEIEKYNILYNNELEKSKKKSYQLWK